MFAFHKPKIYRSVNGCCICKAKSSSSRFTDSKKYEPEFERCFRITERRSGEICNACVLLVKRWKKLPAGTNRDWHHVVDVREKSVNKKPKAKTKAKRVSKKLKTKVIVDNIRDQLRHHLRTSSGGLSDDITIGEDSLSECSNFSLPQSRIPSPTPTESSEDSGIQDEEDEEMDDDDSRSNKKRKARKSSEEKSSTTTSKRSLDKRGSSEPTNRRKMSKSTRSSPRAISSFLDMTFWRKEKICCGLIFKGPNGEVLICPKLLRPCQCRLKSQSSSDPDKVKDIVNVNRNTPQKYPSPSLLATDQSTSQSK